MKQSTTFASVANKFSKVLQRYTMGVRFVAVLTVLLTMGIGQAWAEGTENFEKLTSATDYKSRTWTGVNGQTWSATLARTDQKINGNRGLTFSNASSGKTITMKLTDVQKAAGIGTFTFKYKHPYSDSGKTNTFSISVNGNNYSSGTLSYTSSTATKTITINAVPNSTSITITITGTARLCVDDFSWTSYASNKTVYLKPTSAWDNSSAKFAVYYFNNSTNTNGWSSLMTKVDNKCNNDVYKAEIPSSYTNLIFVRLNSTATGGDWNNKWDQTADLTLSGTNNMYTISAHGSNGGKASGSWSAYKEEVQVTYNFQKTGISNITECVVKGQTTANKSYNLLGWKLDGWYKESACTNQWNFSTTVTSEMTLYAKWSEPATTTVYLNANSNGVNWTQDNADIWVHAFMSSTGEYNDIQMTPVNTCDVNWLKAEGIPYGVDKLIFLRVADGAGVVWSGSNFWNQAAEIGYSGSTSYYQMDNWSAVKTATAYQPSTYTISYNSGGGTGSMASTTVECDGSITLRANSFARTGYTFNGWKDAGGKTYTDKATISNVTSNITLTAQWKANTYYVKFNANNGSGSMSDQIFTYGTAQNLTANDFSRTGYLFATWNTKADGSGTSYADKALVNNLSSTNGVTVNLYAQWTPITYYVQFNGNGSTGGSMSNQSFKYGTAQNLTVNAFTRTDYTFAGWNTKADGSGTNYADEASVNYLSTTNGAIVNLYAKWTKVHTITWKVNGQQYGEKQKVVDGQTIGTLPTKPDAPGACSGKKFMGWTESATVDSEGNNITYINSSTKPDGDKTYHAVFATEEEVPGGTVDASTSVTISSYADGNSWKDATAYTSVTLDKCITASASKGTNTGKYYENGENWRFYQNENAQLTISAATSCTIKTVKVTYTVSNYGVLKYNGTNVSSGSSVTVNAASAIFSVGNTGSATNGQVRVTKIDVTYSKPGGTTTDYTDYVTSCTPQYTITLNPNGGVFAETPTGWTKEDNNYTQTIAENTQLNLPTPTHANNYDFVGWNDGANNHIGNYTATSDVTLTAQWQCKPPASVNVDGTYHFFPGETITLTATPTGGSTPYKYQWQKLVVDQWQDIDQATSATYTKANATKEDVGHYQCVVSSGNSCETVSGSYDVKCLQLYVYYDDHTDNFNLPLTKVDATTATTSVNLVNAGYTYYFKLTDGCEDWYGNTGTMTSGDCTNWLMDANEYCGLTTTKYGDYLFTVDYSDLTQLKVSVTYPSGNQEAGKVIYWDNHDLQWPDGKIYYRIGHSTHNGKIAMTKVPGTANLYQVTTIEYAGFEAWHIANNGCWSEDNSIYKTNTGDDWAATAATAFITNPVTSAAVTVTPSNIHSTGGDDQNNNCEFYQYDITNGMKKHNAKIIAPATGGTITVSYTDHDGTAKSDFTSGDRDLAHTCLLTITATPDAGYKLISLTVNEQVFTSGNIHTLSADAEIEVVWEKKIETALSWSAPTCTATIASPSNEFPTLTVTPEAIRERVQYSSSNPAVATIDATGRIVLKS